MRIFSSAADRRPVEAVLPQRRSRLPGSHHRFHSARPCECLGVLTRRGMFSRALRSKPLFFIGVNQQLPSYPKYSIRLASLPPRAVASARHSNCCDEVATHRLKKITREGRNNEGINRARHFAHSQPKLARSSVWRRSSPDISTRTHISASRERMRSPMRSPRESSLLVGSLPVWSGRNPAPLGRSG